MKHIRWLFTAVLFSTITLNVFGADIDQKPVDVVKKSDEVKISISVKDENVSDVLKSISQKSKEKIIVESSVKGKASLTLTDASLETVLSTFCKSNKLEWRKVYIASDSKLLEQTDRLASTVRLLSAMSFPDMILADSSIKKIGMYCTEKKAIADSEESMVKKLGLVRVYLITNDAVVAKNTDDENKSKAVDEYTNMSQKMMDMFVKMTPEEREQAIMAGINQFEQMDPGYMSSVMQTMMNADPEMLRRMVAKQSQMLFSMSETERRAMLRLNMQASSMITPEQQQILQEDMKAIMEEMKTQNGGNP